MNNIENLRPFKRICVSVGALPTAYLESMSYYECLTYFTKFLNTVIIDGINKNTEAINELQEKFVELQSYVDNYFENLDVQDEIDNKLDEMAENGYFDLIVKDYSIPKEIFRTKLYMNKIGRLNQTDYILNSYAGMQAGCYIGNDLYIYPIIKNDSVGSARIFKLDLATGTETHNDVVGLFHANGCCLNDDKLYFTQSFDNSDNNLYNIVEVDTTSLNITNTYAIDFDTFTPERILGIGYDELNDKYYLIGRNYFFKTDNTFKVESMVAYSLPIAVNLTQQGGTFYKDYVCIVVNNENAIICYNRDGSLSHIIELGEQQNANYFGEIENVNVYDDELYINSALIHNTYDNLYIPQFFKAKINGGGLSQLLSASLTFDNNVNREIVVSKTSYNNLSSYNKFTSDGSYQKPYETIAEALCNIDNKHTYTIVVGDTNTYDEVLSINNKNVIIKGNSSNIGCLKISQSKVSLSSVIIKHAKYRTPTFGSDSTYVTPLYITANSNVWVSGNSGYDSVQCANEGMVYPCIVEGSLFNDGSFNSADHQKFMAELNGLTPLLINADVTSSSNVNIKNNVTRFSLYKDSSVKHTDTYLMDLTDVPLYTNSYRGLWMAININGLESEYQKYDENNKTRRVVIEDIDNNVRYGFKCTLDSANSQFRVTPFTWDFSNNEWVRDTSTEWYSFYMFEV